MAPSRLHSSQIPVDLPQMGSPNTGAVGKICNFWSVSYNIEVIQDTDIATVDCECHFSWVTHNCPEALNSVNCWEPQSFCRSVEWIQVEISNVTSMLRMASISLLVTNHPKGAWSESLGLHAVFGTSTSICGLSIESASLCILKGCG